MTRCSILLGSGETDYSRSPKPDKKNQFYKVSTRAAQSFSLGTCISYVTSRVVSVEKVSGRADSWQRAIFRSRS